MRLHISLLVFALSLVLTTTAFAHRVNIFAWAEDNTIHTESKFSSGKKAQSAGVSATEKASGKVIAVGKTNTSGEWSFTVPEEYLKKKSPLIITLDAGQGHANTWTFTSEDYEDTQGAAQSASMYTAATANGNEPALTAGDRANLSNVELSSLIATAVKQEVSPLKAQIAKLSAQLVNPQPTMRDIFGGIGYILGLLGLAAYMRYRKQQ